MTIVAREALRVRGAYAGRRHPERYSWFDAAHLYAMQEVERTFLALLRVHGFAALDRQRILEVGCGAGVWLRELVKWGAAPERLVGVELLEERVVQARRLAPEGVRLMAGNAASLELPDSSFDIVLQSLVFTSVVNADVRARIASEMLRVATPGGVIVWYDYHVDNPSNPDVRGVSAREMRRLFPGCEIDRRRVTLAPPLARLVAPRSRALYALLAAVPLLKTHYLAAIRPPKAPPPSLSGSA
jgi:ubiquinone/menaquinone biosynthesis C-methylase UbiE